MEMPGTEGNIHVPGRTSGGMPETGRVSRRPGPAVFGRAWKPDLLKKEALRALRKGGVGRFSVEMPGPEANNHVPEGISGGMPEAGRVSRRPGPAVFGRAYPYGA
jgi:hypothetical protein